MFIDIKALMEGGNNLITEWICIIFIPLLFAICTVCLGRILRTENPTNTENYRLICAKECKTITSEFLLSYVLPLFAFDFTKWYEIVEFLIFFLTLGFLCVKHRCLNINITIEIMGYKTYDCVVTNSDGISLKRYVISKNALNITKGFHFEAAKLNNEFLLDLNQKRNRTV